MKKVATFQVNDLGIENSQYFQGYGVTFTPFTHCCYGIGDNPRELLDDALEQAAQMPDAIDVDDFEARILAEYPDFARDDLPGVADEFGDDCEDVYWHIGIRWTVNR